MCQLTDDQLQTFHTNGYVILPALFSQDEVQRMRREADAIMELIINSSIGNQRRSTRLDACLAPDGKQMVRKIQPIIDLSAYLADVSYDERLIAPMRQIMNDEPILMEEKLNYKQPLPDQVDSEWVLFNSAEDGFPIHNDWAYYKRQNYPQNILSSAISMDACTADSGPMRVWPGSHTKHREHDLIPGFGLEVQPGLIDREASIPVLCPPGSVMIFHALLIHNSEPNGSKRPRRLMIYSHYPKAGNMGHDVRNGPTRLREAPHEHAYLRMRIAGDCGAPFQAPSYT
ncbi:MAG: phytanoyl-CoA dioxygenase family protein [Verrucomicrobia bacterium]|nr:phytanoyl-CoA dioxygenase family protein [Verrucomicrobiota bacterium]